MCCCETDELVHEGIEKGMKGSEMNERERMKRRTSTSISGFELIVRSINGLIFFLRRIDLVNQGIEKK